MSPVVHGPENAPDAGIVTQPARAVATPDGLVFPDGSACSEAAENPWIRAEVVQPW